MIYTRLQNRRFSKNIDTVVILTNQQRRSIDTRKFFFHKHTSYYLTNHRPMCYFRKPLFFFEAIQIKIISLTVYTCDVLYKITTYLIGISLEIRSNRITFRMK